jgi:hypothetical protein
MSFMEKKVQLRACFKPSEGFQNFINPLGTKPSIEVCYWYKSRNEFYPFWASDPMFENWKTNENFTHDAIYSAYESFTSNVLLQIRSKYQGKYRIELEYRNVGRDYYYKNSVDMMEPIRLDGIKFMVGLEVKTPKGLNMYIGSYKIAGSIDNRKDIWIEKMLPPVKRIIDALTKEN